jgi:hypothetical protein
MTGISAHERDIRDTVEAHAGANDGHMIMVPTGVLRGLLRDLEMWREIVENDIDKWSFHALMAMAKRMLDEVYPESMFTGESSDSGPRFVVALREVIREIARETP